MEGRPEGLLLCLRYSTISISRVNIVITINNSLFVRDDGGEIRKIESTTFAEFFVVKPHELSIFSTWCSGYFPKRGFKNHCPTFSHASDVRVSSIFEWLW